MVNRKYTNITSGNLGRLYPTGQSSAIAAFLLLFIFFSGSSNGAPRRTTPDGRFNTPCYSWARESKVELCSISFYKLISSPEKFHNKLINVTGFLVVVFGRPVLFPSKFSYDGDIQIEGIELTGKWIPKGIKKEQLSEGIFPVTVTGVFDAKYVGSDVPRLGSIHDIVSVAYAPRIPEN